MKKLAIITTHPIQYNAPMFALLSARNHVNIKVFYTWGKSVLEKKYDPGFGKSINWDIPLLDGYEYSFVQNKSGDPGSHHYKGIDNPTLNKEIREWKPDAILIYGWAFKSHLKAMRHFHGKIPVYFRGDSTLLIKKSWFFSMTRKFFLKWVYSYIDKAFYVGKENKAYFKQHGIRENQLVFAPHAVDNQRFGDQNGVYQDNANRWRQTLGIQSHDLTIVYAGKLEPIKNLDWFIDTVQLIDKKVPLKIIFVGNGPLENQLKNKVTGDTRFIFIEFQNQDNMPLVYRLGDVFILCSHNETWGLSVNEAMACGRAILVNKNCGCASDLVINGINGFVFNHLEKKDLYELIEMLAQNKFLTKKMGLESQQIISTWNFEEVCKAIENIMKNG